MLRNIYGGYKSSKFSEMISYSSIYKTWRIFYSKAGIPDKLMGGHSFRSGFYCQSILNSQLKGITEDNIKLFSQLLAGWKTVAFIIKKKRNNRLQVMDSWKIKHQNC
jgi:hypothetical protein